MLSRRRFVYGIVSAAAVGPSLSDRVNAAQRTPLPSLNGRLSKDVFLALRLERFTAVIDHRQAPFVLVKVSDDACDPGREQFSVMFQGPRDLRLKEGACVLRHATAGTTRLYVKPVGVDDRSSYYVAPFNLLS